MASIDNLAQVWVGLPVLVCKFEASLVLGKESQFNLTSDSSLLQGVP